MKMQARQEVQGSGPPLWGPARALFAGRCGISIKTSREAAAAPPGQVRHVGLGASEKSVGFYLSERSSSFLSSIVCTHVYVCVHVCVCVCIFFFIRTLCPQKDFLILLPFFCCEVCSPICPFRQSSCPVSLCRPSQARGTSLLLDNEDMGAKGGLHLVFQEFSHICPVDILRWFWI